MASRRPRITAAMCAHTRGLAEPRLAPDGERLAFVASVGGRAQLVVVDAAGGPELVVTSEPAPRPAHAYGGGAFDWMPDGAGLVYAAVDGGLWWVAAAGGPSSPVLAAAAAGPAGAPAVAPDGPCVAYVLDQHHVGIVAVEPGAAAPAWPQPLATAADFCFDPTWSPDGALVAWHEWDVPAMPWDDSRIALREVKACGTEGEPDRTWGGGFQVQQPRFSPDGAQLAFLSDEHGWLNVWVADVHGDAAPRPVLEEPFEHGGASWGLGQRSFAWSPDGSRIAIARNEGGFGRLVVVEAASGAVVELGKGVHGGLSWAGDRIAAIRSGARTPTSIVVYEGDGMGERRVVARGPVGGFEAAELVEPEAVDWPGDDGEAVHGRLYRPVVEPATGPGALAPLVVWVHGGPTDQWAATFIPRIAYFVERGWAVLVPDHRGSTGWGRGYAQAMAGRWGELDVSDVAAGMRAAGERGWGDPDRMVPMGGSAGGFTVLNLLSEHPELCAAGVDLFGVADLLDLDETTHRFEAHYLHSVVGPLPAAADAYRDRSPVNRAERITSPLLILQGTDDKVVPPAQSQSIAERLERLGRTVELHLYDGEGHGWGRPDTIIDELDRVESFLNRHVVRWRTSSPPTDEERT